MSLSNNKYEKITKVGEGSFGTVFLGLEKNGGPVQNNENKEKEECKEKNEKKFVALKKLKATVHKIVLISNRIKRINIKRKCRK